MSGRAIMLWAVIVLAAASSELYADGSDIVSGVPQATAAEPLFSDIENDPRRPEIVLVAGRRILQGYPDGAFRPKSSVIERDFVGIIDRLIVACPAVIKPSIELKNPDQPITRLRAVTVIIRAAAQKGDVESIGDPKTILLKCSDFDKIPEWGRKHAAFAVDRGYIRIQSEFRPADPITRSELAELIARCLPPSALRTSPPANYTGLVVDCAGLGLTRSINPALIAEDGAGIYPDPKHLPSIEFMQEQGLVSYVTNAADSKRAGEKPLEVKAIKVNGSARQIAVVSNEDRDAILAAESESHFFANWNVTFVVDPR